ncbi:MAG TPA: phosphoenolpyruvate--protein phosphotransferase [Rhodospirillaceae bacterium]|jgi:phosphotransferase system enzyme I (PtsI)|nr:phosphoenolpyruvate--protein phosphotransferase [Rhodospirillaceae bacterium]MDP6485203.1 phosphoenolpyruvate--protein phosphotransferase [Alphaproteobacteria bacterium]MDP6660801.1 phosphoenolpyruvate--protein phosphotransferase [Alphaproteobacteria bacterium]MDP6780607.1 phosphoenolpyruvate--protein phosphotransferase [Alphaproteobacteria bacterium]HAQ33263.1 phosphoenolpyruvate--protein phosphotransferase [Rhodospirillaceae bacterium]
MAGTRKKKTPAANKERTLEGLGVSSGIAIGPIHVRESGAVEVSEYCIQPKHLDSELARFSEAVKRTRRQLLKLKSKAQTLPEATAEELGYLLDAHLHMLEGSRLIRGVEDRISGKFLNAEAAVQAEISEIGKGFAAMEDSYLAARMEDIREVGNRLVRSLTKSPPTAFSTLPKGSIVVTEEITPADTALLDPSRVAGFTTTLGGPESHTAIMARSLMIPAVLGVPGLLSGMTSGEMMIVDGDAGILVINPSPATLEKYKRRRKELERAHKQLARLKELPAETRNGTKIDLFANIELPREIKNIKDSRAKGIGLLRSEFLFMNRDDLPGEQEQFDSLRKLVTAMKGRPVTIRTLDVGSEKLATSLGGHLMPATNPALGLRAIRLSLKIPELLSTQLAAILRAGAHGPVRILVPMISGVSEIRQVRRIMRSVAGKLKRRKVKIPDPLPPLGIMIETPGAALAAESLARLCEFFAIGTNDLTMYTLAIDRGDEQVAHLYNPIHPAVLRLIKFTTAAGGNAGIPVSVCGEIAGDPRYTALMVGLGIHELSMAPASLLKVKQRIRSLDVAAAQRLVHAVMEQSDPGRISALVDDFNALA